MTCTTANDERRGDDRWVAAATIEPQLEQIGEAVSAVCRKGKK